MKFTDTGSVRVSLTVLSRSFDGVMFRCEVTDTGIGIAAEEIPRLFSDFTQVDPSATRRFGGTGLGLAICDRLVKMMGGDIGCTPNPGGGSTFWFTLSAQLPPHELSPATDEIRGDRLPSSAAEPKQGGPLVLVVEDNEVNSVILGRMLALLGYRSDAARSGAEALEATHAKAYAAIMMDCQMPGMDGFTTTEQIRARENANRRVPIVAITATATTEDQQRCFAAGMDDYLPKPIVMERLAAVLQRWAAIN